MEEKNILHICTGFSADFNGGITNYVRSIAKTQAERGYKVYILSAEGKDDLYEVIPYHTGIANFSYAHKRDSRSLKKLKEILDEKNISLVHIHLMLNVDQRLFKILKGRKYVVSLHDYYFICPRIQMLPPGERSCDCANTSSCLNCFSLLEKNRLVRGASKRVFGERGIYRFPLKSRAVYRSWYENNKQLLEGAEMLFPVSERVEEIYRRSGIQNTYHTLHIGNISAYHFKQEWERKEQTQIDMVLLSSVSRVKGGPLLCSMLSRVHNPALRVHFYGRCNEAEEKMLKAAGIIYHGAYKQADLPQILSQMDMGIMTPIWEDNGPQVVMEMLNSRLPVFATRMGGIPDFVNEENGYLFDPYSEDEIAEACAFLNSLDRAKVEEMKSHIKRTLTPEEHFDELMAYYQKIFDKD